MLAEASRRPVRAAVGLIILCDDGDDIYMCVCATKRRAAFYLSNDGLSTTSKRNEKAARRQASSRNDG